MKYYSLPVEQLTAAQIETWSRLQQTEDVFDSAFFRPEFAIAVASVRSGIEVAVIEQHGESIGFFPYYRDQSNVAYPIADTLTDFQGVVVNGSVDWNARQLLSDCGLSAFYFDHLLTSGQQLQQYEWYTLSSPYMQLSDGFEAYRHNRSKSKSDLLKQVLRKSRKVEREIGPLRLEPFATDEDVFRTLIEWKTNQYLRTDTANVFSEKWTVQLLERIWQQRSETFSGMLSALYVGDQLAAVLMGMLSRGVMHFWFPAYNVELRKYSPGLILLVQIAEAAESIGINRIDLGPGPESYKASFKTGDSSIAVGAVDLRPVVRPLMRFWNQTHELVRTSRFRKPARRLYLIARNLLH